jgi:transposase
MSNESENVRRDWRIPDDLWECIQPLLPPRKSHPLGCHRPRLDARRAMDAIFFVLRTGCNGTPYRTRASVPGAQRTAASKSRPQPGSS